MSTTVTLLLFSGRRDPSWELTAGEESALAERLADVLPIVEPQHLGYRGFLVQSPERRVVIYANAELERFLLETGRAHLDEAVIAAVEGLLESRRLE